MSFYPKLLTTIAIAMLVTPLFAEDGSMQPPPDTSRSRLMIADKQEPSVKEQSDKINVNTASVKDLMKVKGLNATKARAVVAYRKKHGEFKSVDDLTHVNGFKSLSQRKLEAIQKQLDVQ